MVNSTSRFTPKYSDLEEIVKVIPRIQQNIMELKVGYSLKEQEFDKAYYNIELLLDAMTSKTGTSQMNYKVVASQWCYLTDLYFETLAAEFDRLLNESLVDGYSEEELVFKVDYFTKESAGKVIDSLLKENKVK